jgi:hypothetical protein
MSVLECVRFLDQSTAVTCVICGSDNAGGGARCFQCLAPVELSRSVASRGTPARFLTVLGASGAGKTVYLGMLLDILSKGSQNLRGLPNGSFSVSLQQETITALQSQRFPQKTANEADHWKWIHCEVTHAKKPKVHLDIVTPDLAGEAITLEIEQTGTFGTIRHVARRSQAFLILIDSLRARDAGREEDLCAMKLFSYVCSLHGGAGASRRGKLRLPVALVFTKCDLCPEAQDDPGKFAAANLPGLLRLCDRNLTNFGFFATGIVGASATIMDDHGFRMRIPLHIEPRGVVEPVVWIMKHL